MIYDVVVIGAGPAGYTAALYTSRAFLKTTLISGNQPGGQLTTTTEIDNFPGFPKGIMGPQLMIDMALQAKRFGTEIIADEVKRINKNISTFSIVGSTKSFDAKTVIVATGASAMRLGLPSEDVFWGKGVSACATCDGFFFRGKEVVVVGGGDTAMEEATFLSKFVSHVTIIHRRVAFRASAIMVDRAKKDPKISFLLNKEIVEIYGDSVVRGVRLKSGEEVKTDGVFLAIGHKPSTEFVKGFVELDAKGYVVTRGTETSVPGVFAAGDCVDHKYRQAIVAAGAGCMAAIDAEKYVSENHT